MKPPTEQEISGGLLIAFNGHRRDHAIGPTEGERHWGVRLFGEHQLAALWNHTLARARSEDTRRTREALAFWDSRGAAVAERLRRNADRDERAARRHEKRAAELIAHARANGFPGEEYEGPRR